MQLPVTKSPHSSPFPTYQPSPQIFGPLNEVVKADKNIIKVEAVNANNTTCFVMPEQVRNKENINSNHVKVSPDQTCQGSSWPNMMSNPPIMPILRKIPSDGIGRFDYYTVYTFLSFTTCFQISQQNSNKNYIDHCHLTSRYAQLRIRELWLIPVRKPWLITPV